ncbi:MAG: hypothetical protein VW862_01860, partial [Euryarchaeota archaeon]
MVNGVKKSTNQFSKPTSRETGILLAVILILVAGVVTWDLTHQSIPAGGVDAPVGVEAADGWLITLDSKDENSLLVIHDLSDLNSQIDVLQPILDENSTYTISGDHLLMANSTQMMLVNINNPSTALFTIDIEDPTQIEFISDDKIVVLQNGELTYFDFTGSETTGVSPPNSERVSLLETSGDKIALVFESSPDTIQIGYVDSEGLISTKINSTANEIEDSILANAGKMVDTENASIIEISMYEEYLSATVDVNATTR